MRDSKDIVKLIKQTAVEAVNAEKPSGIYFGTVTGSNPLKIQIDQKLILGANQLVLTQNVCDYEVPIKIDWETDEAEGHTHKLTGDRTVVIENGLKNGDQVILLRQQGGQKYIVLDKVMA